MQTLTSEHPYRLKLGEARLRYKLKRTILVVEDDEIIRTQLYEILRHDYDVLLAANGVEAIACYENSAHEIATVITDWEMPIVDGVGLTNWLRQRAPGLPIIMITGNVKGAEIEPLLDLPCFILLWKPFDVEQLMSLLAGFTGNTG